MIRFRSNTSRVLCLLAVLLAGSLLYHVWTTETALAVPWVPDPGAEWFAQQPLGTPDAASFITAHKLPLRTLGRDVVDVDLRRFRLAAVNWYGASDELFVPGGLDVRHRADLAQAIRALGFNTVRLPYSDEMVVMNPTVPAAWVAANADLAGRSALDVFEAVVTALTDAGLAVIVNNHITAATWCCGADPCDALWANDHLPSRLCRVRQSEADWIDHWETVMRRFVHNPRVLGADLRNEVRSLWGTLSWDRWAAAAERCGNRLLQLQPHWLVIVGGTASGNDLRGVARRPVRLDRDHRVVYSAHVYAWSGWGELAHGGPYSHRAYPSFAAAMRRNWAYLLDENLAPVWVGEFGAPRDPSVGDARYWRHLVRFLEAADADFGYWAVNPRKPAGNVTETYGLLGDDWATAVVDYRMRDLAELLGLRAPEDDP